MRHVGLAADQTVPTMSDIATASSRALGTTVQVAVTDDTDLEAAMSAVLAWLAQLDMAASRFRADSELTRLNAADGAPLHVSPLLAQVISVALDVAAMTDGIVDPTVGSAMATIGYDRDFEEILRGEVRSSVGARVPAPGWRSVELDRDTNVIRLPIGVQLDVGSSAKAFAADEAAALAGRGASAGVLVNLGGDIAVAGTPPEGGWRVRVTDDHAAAPDAAGQTVAVTAGGLATSSTTVRTWSVAGAKMHHIVDPRTGGPAAVVWRTVSATGRTCVAANAASTAAIVLGDAAPEWLRRHGVAARLVAAEGRVLHVGGWPEDGDDAAMDATSPSTFTA